MDGPTAKQIAAMSGPTRRAYLRELRDDLTRARAELAQARAAYAQRRADVRHRCKEAKAKSRTRKREIRDRYLREVDQWEANEKKAVHDVCVVELEDVRRSALDGIAKIKKRKQAIAKKKNQIDTLTGQAEKRRKDAMRRQERESEADDFVAYDLEAEDPAIAAFFRAHARTRFAPSKVPKNRSRAEHVLHYIHENPEELIRWRQDDAERWVSEVEKKEAEYYAQLERAKKADATARRRETKKKAKKKTTKKRKKKITQGDEVPF